MSRMYSGARGKSRSTKPSKKVSPSWVQYSPKEIELLIVKMAKEGKSFSEIGLHLRDAYGIPDVRVVIGKSISKVVNDKNLQKEIPEDLMSLIKKAVLVRKHMLANKQDMTALRGLTLTESKIKRLTKYYKAKGKLPLNWKYDPERIKLVVE